MKHTDVIYIFMDPYILQNIILQLKVNQFRKQTVKPRILPKNERMNSFYYYATCFRSFFGRTLGQKKKVSRFSDL